MSRKINPTVYRLGINKDWKSRWFAKPKNYGQWLEEDENVRRIIMDKVSRAGIAGIDIERTHDKYSVIIKASRPGLVIGRGGEGVINLEKALRKVLPKSTSLSLTVEELKRTEVSAAVVGQNLAWDLEKRMRFRRVMKRHMDIVMQNREVQGVRIMMSGRLNGAEIARSEHLEAGKLPLTTLRADIDYAKVAAATKYGVVGIKVWIYKGDIFENKKKANKE